MIFDFHAACGNAPRQGKHWSLDDLAQWHDLCGVDGAVVESADGRLRFDEQAQSQLLAACAASDGRFLPAATISLESDVQSPRIASSARARGFACAVLRGELFEESRVLHQVLDALERAPLPVYRELAYDEIDAAFRLAQKYEGIAFVFAFKGYKGLELNHRLIERPNAYLSIARNLYCLGQLETGCRLMGPERILYASDLPQQHPARPLGVIADAEIDDAAKVAVRGQSALKLLRQHGIEVVVREGRAPLPEPPCPIIDAHGHVGADYRRPDFDWSVEAVVRYLERAGGELLYVSGIEGIFGDVAGGNRQTLEAMRVYPERLRGYLVINPWMGEECVDSIRRCRAMGFSGLKPYPIFDYSFADPVMEPVWALAEELDLPVLSHSSASDLRQVLERHPQTRMLAAHMAFEHEEKAELAGEFPNVVLEISGAGAGPEDVLRAVEIAGEENIVFGSDINNHALGYTLHPLLCSGLPEPTLKAILRTSALRFFGDAGG